MELAWCSKCKTDVALARAVAELPCVHCGSTNYFMIIGDGDRDAMLAESDRMMRVGRWPEAGNALRDCFERGIISAAEFDSSSMNLMLRKKCAASAASLVARGNISLVVFRGSLMKQFDKQIVDWLLREFRGIRLVKEGKSYLVEAT